MLIIVQTIIKITKIISITKQKCTKLTTNITLFNNVVIW